MSKRPVDTGFADELLKLALREGADEAEVYVSFSRHLSIESKELKIDTLERSDSVGYSVRIFKDKRLGFSYSTNPADIREVARNAVEASSFAEADEFNGLPSPTGLSQVAVYDEEVASLSEKDAIDMVLSMEGAALKKDARVARTRNASGSFGTSTTKILNSRGVDAEYSSTSCSAHIMAVAEEAGESQMGWDYQGSRFLNDIAFAQIGSAAALKAVQSLGAKKITPVKGFILLDPSVAAEFIGILSSALSSEAVQKGKSMLAGKLGQNVISGHLNIMDSGLLNGRLGSRPADAEGLATSEKILIQNGVLLSYLYNTYTGRKDGRTSTGNAVRGGFSGLPAVGPTNLFVTSTSADRVSDLAGLIKSVDKGIYVTETMGMHTANPISGEYSVGVSGLWIERGEMVNPVKEAVISGNILQLFKNIIMIGDDLRFYGNIGTSHLLAGDIDISG